VFTPISSDRTQDNPTQNTKPNVKHKKKAVSHASLSNPQSISGGARTLMVTNSTISLLPKRLKMETLKQQETKAFLQMAEHIKFLEKECEALRNQVQELEKQLYGSR